MFTSVEIPLLVWPLYSFVFLQSPCPFVWFVFLSGWMCWEFPCKSIFFSHVMLHLPPTSSLFFVWFLGVLTCRFAFCYTGSFLSPFSFSLCPAVRPAAAPFPFAYMHPAIPFSTTPGWVRSRTVLLLLCMQTIVGNITKDTQPIV